MERDRRSALIGYGERSLGEMQHDKFVKQAPSCYNIPSTLENKKGNAFHGGRYVRLFLCRKLEGILVGKKISWPNPVLSIITFLALWIREELL